MSLKLIISPDSEPVTLAEAKAHLRVSDSADDAKITALIIAAREMGEHMTGRAFLPQTWEKILDGFPANEIKLPRAPLLGVTSVIYVDSAGAIQTLSSALYSVDTDSEPGWLLVADGQAWPGTRDVANAVRVRYTCGYADAATVPASIKQWMLLKVGEGMENREASSDRPAIAHSFVDHLLDRYLVPEI